MTRPAAAGGLRAETGRAIFLCAALSVLVHGVLLTWRFSSTPPLVGTSASASASGSAAGVTRMRLVAARPAPEPTERADPRPAATAQAPIEPTERPPLERKLAARLQDARATEAATPGVQGADATTADARPERTYGPDHYFARGELSVGPAASAPVVLDYPSTDGDSARHVGELLLFIDEHGEVRRIDAVGEPLPPALEQAARQAFMAAPFVPGEIEGRAVKSRIRVEVVFDNTPVN